MAFRRLVAQALIKIKPISRAHPYSQDHVFVELHASQSMKYWWLNINLTLFSIGAPGHHHVRTWGKGYSHTSGCFEEENNLKKLLNQKKANNREQGYREMQWNVVWNQMIQWQILKHTTFKTHFSMNYSNLKKGYFIFSFIFFLSLAL